MNQRAILHPVFSYGDLSPRQALGWALSDLPPKLAQVRGRLWRLPSGVVLLEHDLQGLWIDGELRERIDEQRLRLVQLLLNGGPGSTDLVEVRVISARMSNHAQRVATWCVKDPMALRRLGARPLKIGNWARWHRPLEPRHDIH